MNDYLKIIILIIKIYLKYIIEKNYGRKIIYMVL